MTTFDLARVPGWSFSLVLLVQLTSLISTVAGLNCVQCVSVEVPSCLHGHIPPSPCLGMDDGSTFCIKSVGSQVAGHGHFVSRGCSKALETNCTQNKLDGDLYVVCHHSCVQDGCNTASSRTSVDLIRSVPTLVTVAAALLSRYSVDCRH